MTTKKHLPPAVREKIRAGQLADRLEKHALGIVEMTTSQVRAAEILLRKVVPDLSSIQAGGDVSHHITVSWKE
jgi:hypothetical protein